MKILKTTISSISLLLLGFLLTVPLQSVQAESTPWYRNPWNSTVTQAIKQLSTSRIEQLPIPILFGVSVGDFTPNFGVPRSGGRSHEGQDILGVLGTPIVSPTEAVVTYIRYGASAGHSIYTAIPGGETLAYLHLDSVNPDLEVGDTLKTGTLLGYLGDSGNAKGGAAHLHLEILTDRPTNPYPRLTKEFSADEKQAFMKTILTNLNETKQTQLKNFITANFPDAYEQTSNSIASNSAPAQNLTIGARGADVITLQKHLITFAVGNNTAALKLVGATGYFGQLTKASLTEYQQMVGIIPADGNYAASTRSYIENKTNSPIIEPPQVAGEKIPVEKSTPQGMPQENLTIGNRGDSVIWLQKYLIGLGYGPSATSLSNVGATGFFGSLTAQALAEYQRVKGISPAVGYYGPLTRGSIE